jgi:hypothetical protein
MLAYVHVSTLVELNSIYIHQNEKYVTESQSVNEKGGHIYVKLPKIFSQGLEMRRNSTETFLNFDGMYVCMSEIVHCKITCVFANYFETLSKSVVVDNKIKKGVSHFDC